MVILGLGSNLGDRLANLRFALRLIKKIPGCLVQQVSPIYVSDALVPAGASKDWDIPYFNLAIRCETTLTPYELLKHTKLIETQVGRVPNKKWGPRIIDIDLLAWDDLVLYDEVLHIPHESLTERPFALWPLADIAPRWSYPIAGSYVGQTATELTRKWGSRFTGEAPFHTKQIQHRIDTPELVGIMNLTPDSFSEDGISLASPPELLDKARALVNAGASVIDIGAEATGPKAIPITPEEEWQRLASFLEIALKEIKQLNHSTKLSIDTRHPLVAKRALDLGIDWINDVAGLTDPEMLELMSHAACDIIVMHQLGVPVTQSSWFSPKQNPVDEILRWAEKHLSHLEKNGIVKERIIFDVGIGYGKSTEHSLELIKYIDAFKTLNSRLLIGHSRKAFLQQFTSLPPAHRDIETTALSLYLANKEIDYLRVHDVDLHSRAFKVMEAVR